MSNKAIALIFACAFAVGGLWAYITLDALSDRSALRSDVRQARWDLDDARQRVSLLELTSKSRVDSLVAVFEKSKARKVFEGLVGVVHTPSGDQEFYVDQLVDQFQFTPRQVQEFVVGLENQGAQFYLERCYRAQSLAGDWSAGYCSREKRSAKSSGGGGASKTQVTG